MSSPTDTMSETTTTTDHNTGFDAFTTRTEQFAREDPMRAVGVSFLVGLFLNVLPIGALLAGVLRLAMALVKPALVILGAMKLYEEVSLRQK